MTNKEKFEEVFGLKISKHPDDPCGIIDSLVCIDAHGCEECLLHDFWEKDYKENKDDK